MIKVTVEEFRILSTKAVSEPIETVDTQIELIDENATVVVHHILLNNGQQMAKMLCLKPLDKNWDEMPLDGIFRAERL